MTWHSEVQRAPVSIIQTKTVFQQHPFPASEGPLFTITSASVVLWVRKWGGLALTILKGEEICFEVRIMHSMVLKSKAQLLVLLLLLCHPFCGLGEDWSTRRLSRHKVTPSCGELVLKSQCSENSKCRWCTSEDLDDMCFSKSEALRLPHQVFSCATPEIRWY